MRIQASRASRVWGGECRLRERFARTVTQKQQKHKTKQKREKRENTKKGKKCRQSQHKLPSTPQGGGLLLLPLPQRSSPWDACTNRRATLRWVRPVVQRSHMLRQSAVGDAVVNWKSIQLFVHVTRPFPLDLTFARAYGGSQPRCCAPRSVPRFVAFSAAGIDGAQCVRTRGRHFTHSSSRRGSSGRRSQERRLEETKTYCTLIAIERRMNLFLSNNFPLLTLLKCARIKCPLCVCVLLAVDKQCSVACRV